MAHFYGQAKAMTHVGVNFSVFFRFQSLTDYLILTSYILPVT